MKIEIILFCAVLINKVNKKYITTIKGMAAILLVPVIFALMLWKITSNLSSAIIVAGIAVVMLFVADCILAPKPFPKIPPEPMAYNACNV